MERSWAEKQRCRHRREALDRPRCVAAGRRGRRGRGRRDRGRGRGHRGQGKRETHGPEGV